MKHIFKIRYRMRSRHICSLGMFFNELIDKKIIPIIRVYSRVDLRRIRSVNRFALAISKVIGTSLVIELG